MELNCQAHRWPQDNPLLPSRSVFEQKNGGPNTQSDGTEEEEAPKTVRDGGPITTRSHEHEIAGPEPKKRAEVVVEIRKAAEESLEETVERLKKKIAKLEEDNEIKGKQIEKLDQDNADLWGEKEDLWDERKELLEENAEMKEENAELAAKNKVLKEENTDLAAENSRLKELALEDPMTGLGTKEYFYDRMLGMVDEAGRYGKDFSLLFVDLDKFKDINDKVGHLVGDEALKKVGEIIEETMRISDTGFRLEQEGQGKGFRYGGEELVIILPETNKEQARTAAERLRKAIEEELRPHLANEFEDEREIIENEIMGTASIGITSYESGGERGQEDDEELINMIIHEADKAVYAAKNGGRNQVRVYGEQTLEEKAKVDEDLIDIAAEKGPLDEYVAAMKKSAEDTIPEPSMREKALREAADQIRKGNAA